MLQRPKMFKRTMSDRGHPLASRLGTGFVALALAFTMVDAMAQGIPGLVISGPAPGPPPPQPQAAAPQATAKPKPKPKPKAVVPASVGSPEPAGGQAIVMLVNDEPITAYEIEQRARFMSLSSNIGSQVQDSFKRLITQKSTEERLRAILEETIKANQGKTREQIIAIFEQRKLEFAKGLQQQALSNVRSGEIPKHRKAAREELIEEKLKVQEAKRLGMTITDEEGDRIFAGIAERNKQTPQQFVLQLKGMGVDASTMKARFVAAVAWREVVRRRYQGLININQRDIDRLAVKADGSATDTQELQIQRVVLALPSQLDQASHVRRMAEADGIRRKFAGCKSTQTALKDVANAKFEDLKYIRPSTVAEPTRTFLQGAKDGEMLPPQTTGLGLEVYVVCGRRALTPSEDTQNKARDELQSQELERRARRDLRDLRDRAVIDQRAS